MKVFTLFIGIIVLKASFAFNCLSQNSTINSTSTYGTLSTVCFNVSLDTVSEIIVHANTISILGFSFNFLNDAGSSYVENSANIQNHSIKLNTTELRGVAVGGGTGINSIKFLLYDTVFQNFSWTDQYGDSSNSSLSYLDQHSSFTSDFLLTTINGCIDCNNSLSLPSLVFDYTSCLVSTTTSSTTITLTNTTVSSTNTTLSSTNATVASQIILTVVSSTSAPFWSEWNPWFSCLMTRERIVNNTVNNIILTEKQNINVSCDLVFTVTEQATQTQQIKNATTSALTSIQNQTQNAINSLTKTYQTSITTSQWLSIVAIMSCSVMILAVMSCDIGILLNSFELFRNFKEAIKDKISQKFKVNNNSDVSKEIKPNTIDTSAVSEENQTSNNTDNSDENTIKNSKKDTLEEKRVLSYSNQSIPENNEYSESGFTPVKSVDMLIKPRIYKTLNARKMVNSSYQSRKFSYSSNMNSNP